MMPKFILVGVVAEVDILVEVHYLPKWSFQLSWVEVENELGNKVKFQTNVNFLSPLKGGRGMVMEG